MTPNTTLPPRTDAAWPLARMKARSLAFYLLISSDGSDAGIEAAQACFTEEYGDGNMAVGLWRGVLSDYRNLLKRSLAVTPLTNLETSA